MNQALIKHFKLSEADLNQMQAALQPHQTILDVLFEKSLIDPVAYLAWAKEHYSLPVLKTEFLDKNNNVEALLGRYKNVFPKNVVPFHELEGTLYVMWLEPTPFDAAQTVQYVLAPYDVLQKYASKNETSIVSQPAIEMPVEHENTNPLFKDLELSKEKSPLDSFSFDNMSLGDAEPSEEAPAGSEDQGDIQLEEKADVPAGLNFPANPTDTNDSFVTDKPVTSVDLNSLKFDSIMPMGEEQKAAPATPVPAPTAAPAPTITPTPVAASAPAVTPVAPKVSVMTADSLVAKHPPKNKTASTITPPPAMPAAPTPQAPVAAVAPEAPQPVPAQVIPMPTPAAPVQNPGSQFEGILNAMKKYFDQTMVLVFNNGNLEPVAWDTTWAKAPHAQAAIDVSTPSIFRIVNETQHPYHGHIVPNPINESFFSTWNKGQFPQHVTICPIVHDKKIYGMVLGTTTKAASKKYQLHHVQEIANDAFSVFSSSKAA